MFFELTSEQATQYDHFSYFEYQINDFIIINNYRGILFYLKCLGFNLKYNVEVLEIFYLKHYKFNQNNVRTRDCRDY